MMRALGALDLTRAWEWGESRHPVDRALVLLALGLPGMGREELAALPLGRRDALLLRLRALTLGPVLEVFVSCKHCNGSLEFSGTTEELGPLGPLTGPPGAVFRGGGGGTGAMSGAK